MEILKILFLSGAIILSHGLGATEYYVATNGNDSNAGTEAAPWKTINYAASTLTEGDTVYIKAGTYELTSRIIPANSGTSGNYITYSAYKDDSTDEYDLVIIDGTNASMNLDPPLTGTSYGVICIYDKAYIKVTNLNIINSDHAGIFIANSDYITVKDNKTCATDSSGVYCSNSDDIIIDGNEIQQVCLALKQECLTVIGSRNVEVMNNHVFDGDKEGIDIKDGCSDVKVYNNYVHNVASVGLYVDASANDSDNIAVFNNIVHNSDTNGIAICSEGTGVLENVKVFNNISYNNTSCGIVIGWADADYNDLRSIRVFNNTCYNNLHRGIASYTRNEEADDILVKNNITSDNTSYQIYMITTNVSFDYTLINGTYALTGDNSIIDSPDFENPDNNNLFLQSISPAVDAGGFMTVTTDSGTGTVITVDDAIGFIDGSASDFVCKVIVGDNSPVELISVDYDTSKITVGSSISWSVGDNVNYVYAGDAPDIGGREYDLAAHWRLDGDATDASPYENTGTAYGSPSWSTTAMVGGSLILDGVNDYVDCYNDDIIKPGYDDFTVEYWVKPTALPPAGSYAGVIFKGNGNISTQDGWLFRYWNASGKIYFHMGDGTNNLGGFSINYVLPLNEWTHITLVVDRDKGYFAYVNGEFTNSYTKDANGDPIDTSANEVSGPSLRIGRDWSTSNYFFTGEIDDVKIYRRALNKFEVANNHSLKDDIVAHWKLDSNAADASPYENTGTVYGSPSWNTTSGKIDDSLILDGVNDYVDCQNNDIIKPGYDDFTIEYWVKPTSYPPIGSYTGVIFKGNGDINTQDGWLFRYWNATKKIYFHMGDGTNNLGGFYINYELPLNEWTHITLVVDREKGYFAYVNGEFSNSYTVDTSANEVNGPSLRIGRDWSTLNYFFTGEIDDVKIYRKALTEMEIINNYTE